MHQGRNPDSIHAPVGRYVHQIEVTSPERMLFISGQVGMSADGVVPVDPVEQFEVALQNVLRNVEAAGMEVADLTKLTTYVVGELDPVGRRAILDQYLGSHVSCSTLVFVASLASPNLKVEIDASAAR
jgi:2-iminobutanoate/2-iminopropanoate deaminase